MRYPQQLDNDPRGERWRVSGSQIIAGVHAANVCEGRCVLHNPSDHRMRGFKLVWLKDTHMFERICKHNVSHPDPDDDMREATGSGIHACDGCCDGTYWDRTYCDECEESGHPTPGTDEWEEFVGS